jgi:uncharacterized protein YciW
MTNSYAPHGLPFSAERDDLFQAHDPLAVAHACFAPSEAGRGGEAYHQYLEGEQQQQHSQSGSPSGVREGEEREDSTGWIYSERRFAIEAEGKLTRGMCIVE